MIPFAAALALSAMLAQPPAAQVLAVTARAPQDGTYTYTGSRGGVPFLRASVVVSDSGSGVEITENDSGSAQGISGSAQATLNLRPDLSPTAYSASVSGTGLAAKSALVFSGATATLSGTAGNQTFNLMPGTSHFAVVDAALLDGYAALPAQLAAWNNASVTLIIPVYAQSSRLALNSTTPVRPPAVPATDLSLSFGQTVTVTEWYDPQTLVPDEIDIPSLTIVLTRVR